MNPQQHAFCLMVTLHIGSGRRVYQHVSMLYLGDFSNCSMKRELQEPTTPFLSYADCLAKGCPERRIIFIAHCFGGIVVEKAILKAIANETDQDRMLLASISGIVLLGTPHRGSNSAGLANIVAGIAAFFNCGQRSPILKTVKDDSQMLADTVREFARRAFHLNLRIHCFYEERETDIARVIRPLIRPFLNATSKVRIHYFAPPNRL